MTLRSNSLKTLWGREKRTKFKAGLNLKHFYGIFSEGFKKHCGKEENADNQHFHLFPHFSILGKTNLFV